MIPPSEQKEKDINNWLAITSSREAKWWYSTFHNVCALVGAGVLGLPYAMSELGWGPGVTAVVLSWIITLYTLWQMVEMHECVPGKRFDRYHELGQEVFGPKLGLWIVVPQQLTVEVGINIVYCVTGGKSLKKIHDIGRPDQNIKLSFFILMFGGVQLILSQLPNFNSITFVSFFAAFMSVSYSTIVWAVCLNKGVKPDVTYTPRSPTTTGRFFDFVSALGDIAFSYAAHNVALEIQATIPSTPEAPSKKQMMKGVYLAYILVGMCYFPVAFIGYYTFGNSVEDNILMSLQNPAWVIITANALVVIHVIGSYQVFAMPVFDMIESYLVKEKDCKPSVWLRFFTRSSYVCLTVFLGIAFPFFGALLGLLGGFVLAPTTYYLPCIMWLKIMKPKTLGLTWFINWICIVVGVALMILAPIGAIYQIYSGWKSYTFFS